MKLAQAIIATPLQHGWPQYIFRMNTTHTLKLIYLLGWVVLFSGCASPAQRMDERAFALGYRRLVVLGEGYEHVVYNKEGRVGDVLHVYLEGDGSPWARKRLPAADPTPRTQLMFDLMALDSAPSLYLGRPCYHGLNESPTCTPDLWTGRRYSEAVVESMTTALTKLSAPYKSVALMGYSGGGTLAMLIAQRLPKTTAVVTIAANLDTARWAALHHELLPGSLNPASRPPLSAHIRQIHLAGGKDEHVPPMVIRDAVMLQPGADFKVFEQFDHSCCWQAVWPAVLESSVAE